MGGFGRAMGKVMEMQHNEAMRHQHTNILTWAARQKPPNAKSLMRLTKKTDSLMLGLMTVEKDVIYLAVISEGGNLLFSDNWDGPFTDESKSLFDDQGYWSS